VHTVRSVCHNRNVHLLQLGEVVASVSLAVAHAGDGHAGSEGVPHVAALHQATKEKEAAASEKKRHGEKCNVLQGWEMAGREEFRLAVLPCPPDRLPCRARTASSDRKQYCASYVPCRRRNSSTNSPVTGTVLVESSGTIVTGTPEWSTSYAAKGSPNTLNSVTGLTAKAVNTEQTRSTFRFRSARLVCAPRTGAAWRAPRRARPPSPAAPCVGCRTWKYFSRGGLNKRLV
jgi:hypothetical protein